MTLLNDKFRRLVTDDAPGQEMRQADDARSMLAGGDLPGVPVDFSHGDVDAFEPTPTSLDAFNDGVRLGGRRAYTEYRGDAGIRDDIAAKLARFTGAPVSAADGLIITPGTQGALFLALASTTSARDKVVVVRPDYFANRKLVEFLDAQVVPVSMDYLGASVGAGLDLSEIEDAFKAGATAFVFSNPNNPTGAVYSQAEIAAISRLAGQHGVKVIVDQLYARLVYDGTEYTHLRAMDVDPENVVTIIGPSKTESLSGYRLGVALGSPEVVTRMERLQAIVSLRAAGYAQSVLQTWFAESEGWMAERIRLHQAIRDDIHSRFAAVEGVEVRLPDAGSYLFPRLPKLSLPTRDFVRALRRQAAVTVTPGTEFSPRSHDSIRLNFSQAHDAAVSAVDRIVKLLGRYRA